MSVRWCCWCVLAVAWACHASGVRADLVTAPRCPETAVAAHRCQPNGTGRDEHQYLVDGSRIQIDYADGGYFVLNCQTNLTVDNDALPRFDTQLRVNQVKLVNCSAPSESYNVTFSVLNVLVLEKLSLSGAGRITAEQLAGLRLQALEVEYWKREYSWLRPTELAPGTLASLTGLQSLVVDGVPLPPDEVHHLPRTLKVLRLIRTGTALPAAALQRLQALVSLSVRQPGGANLTATGALQGLSLEADAAYVPSVLVPSLRSLTLFGWAERRPSPWSQCGALDVLQTRHAAAEALPARWVQACGRLRELRVEQAPALAALHGAALAGAAALRELYIVSCALTSLPTGLLDDAKNLTVLDLSGNRLHMLPSGTFASTKSLEWLYLSNNNLSTSVFSSLAAVTSLTKLRLNNNVNLRDSCGGADVTARGMSPLLYLNKLTELHLRNTSTELICQDWRVNMPLLTRLDLTGNKINSITYTDLQFNGKEEVLVDLRGNNVSSLLYTREDYAEVAGGATSRAHVLLAPTLRCTCADYWAALALRRRPAHVRLDARCAGGARLAAAPDALLCAAPQPCANVSRACRCGVRPRLAPPGRVLRLQCERAGLRRVPRLADAAAFAWDLRLAHNSIAALRRDELPAALDALDLRYNELSIIDVDVARALVADEERRVWLSHNPLACNCTAADGLAVLARAAAVQDFASAQCAGGGLVANATLAPCAPPAPAAPYTTLVAGAAAALALLAAGALLALLARPARLKAALQTFGWWPGEDDDGEYRFDVFVSFSHGDERFVREQLVARLERGPARYRLCLHYRDWAPGGWIPAQIAASVRASRRTLAVVSEHFLRSAWARAEFREAHALALRQAAPRLVVVLLAEPAALPLDARLRSYLATNTYVRWGDPWFWHKLHKALPRSRLRGPVPADLAPAPADLAPAPADLAPVPADLAPAPADLAPAPSDLAPAPADLAPVPADLAPAPADLAPAPSDLAPAPADLAPAPADLAPAPSDLAPAPADLAPAPSDLAPAPADLAPAPVGPDPVPFSPDLVPPGHDLAAGGFVPVPGPAPILLEPPCRPRDVTAAA